MEAQGWGQRRGGRGPALGPWGASGKGAKAKGSGAEVGSGAGRRGGGWVLGQVAGESLLVGGQVEAEVA
ncbi:hypothetical protein Misp01_68910 [Microtetraspora sp. NBRC 13810]|nr:hypothetical protein Misp01_68910 [Microtetraspora sp. NBRC 13810]